MSDPLTNSPAGAKADADSQGPLDATQAVPAEPHFAAPARAGEVGTFGRYRVLEKLGQGGMGCVYLGYDASLDRKVALKVMLPQYAIDADSRERFLREARSAAKVRSDHVVTIHDVGTEKGSPFIAMEYLLGLPLDKFLKTRGELPLVQVMRIARETALGLAAAHALGMVHRDVKPGNVWLEAPKGRVKLLDFGLARADTDEQLTGEGAVVGTPAYMSPEQGRGLKLDARSDLFSLGVMLYRLCTGKLPFTGHGAMAVLTSLAVDTPADPRTLNPDLPEAVAQVITKLLAKSPDGRFQTARELIDAITEIENPRSGELPVVVPVSAPQLTIGAQTQNVWEGIDDSAPVAVPLATAADSSAPAPAPPPPVRRGSRWPLALAAVAVLAAAGAVAAVFLWPKKPPEVVKDDGPKPGETPPPDRPPQVPKKPGSFQPLGKKYDPPADIVAAVRPVRPAKVATLDHLNPADPKFVPPEEKFPWQPKELVAVLGSHRQRMPAILQSVGFSADGKTAFAGFVSAGLSYELLDAETGSRANLPPWSCFSPDGTRAASGKKVWDVANPAAAPAEYPSLQGSIVALLGPDRALVQARDELAVWALGERPEPRGQAVAAAVFAVAPDGKRLAAAPKGGGQVTVYDLTADGPRSKFALNGPNGELKGGVDGNRLALSSAGHLAIANPERPLQVWNVSGPEPRLQHPVGAAAYCCQVAFLADGVRLAVVIGLGIELWTIEGDRPRKLSEIKDLGLTGSNVRVMAAAPVGAAVVTGHLHGAVRLWGVTPEGQLFERNPLRGQPMVTAHSAVSPDGRFAALFNEDGRFHVWDWEKWTATPLDGKGVGACFTPDGAELAAHVGGKLGVGAAGAAERREFGGGHWPGAYSPDGKLLAAVSASEVVVWDVSANPPRERGRVNCGWAPQLARFTPDGRFLIAARTSAGVDPGAFRVFAVTAGGLAPRQEGAFPFPCGHFAPSPDGTAAVLCRAVGGLALCEVRDGLISDPVREDRLPAVYAEYAPDGRSLLVGTATGVKVLDAGTLAVLRDVPLRGATLGARWHPDGRHALVTNADRTTYVLRLDTDADRRGAAWVLSAGGTVQLDGKPVNYTPATGLPAERFTLTSAALATRTVTADGLANLRGCTQLRFLMLNSTATDNDGLAHFAGCTQLMQVNLNQTKVTDDGLAAVRGWTTLSQLHLVGTKISDKGLVHLKGLKGLHRLALDKTDVTDAAVNELGKALPNCRISWNGRILGGSDQKAAALALSHGGRVQVNDGPVLEKYADLPLGRYALTAVNLKKCTLVADEALATFAGCERLAALVLTGTAVTDAGLATLKDFPALRELEVGGPNVTDAGLAHLHACKGLTALTLDKTAVTAEGIAAFRKARPECRVTVDGKPQN